MARLGTSRRLWRATRITQRVEVGHIDPRQVRGGIFVLPEEGARCVTRTDVAVCH